MNAARARRRPGVNPPTIAMLASRPPPRGRGGGRDRLAARRLHGAARRDARAGRAQAGRPVAHAQAFLAGEKESDLHFDDNPSLGETPKTLSSALERPLREESAEWERIRDQRERAEIERRQGQDRRFSR